MEKNEVAKNGTLEMNANELADSAKEIHTTIEALEFVQKVIPLLRQQQAEIKKLKLQLEYMFKQEIKNAEVIK